MYPHPHPLLFLSLNSGNDAHMNMETNLNNHGRKFVNSTLQSIDERFGQDSRIIIDNISMFTKLNDHSNEEVDHKLYERTDKALL